jgi:AcrR family transcriptional regulator
MHFGSIIDSVDPMTEEVKKSRPYRSPRRAESAASTRAAILEASRALFLERGYVPTTVSQIARRAGVNVDTLYAVIGPKPDLLRAVVESALSGESNAVPAEERSYVRQIRAATSATDKIDIYARALVAMAPRTAPVFAALKAAALVDASCAALHREISERRAANMRLFAADLRATNALRPDLSDDDVADVVWSMNSTDYYLLLVRDRGWSDERFERHLSDAWRRLFLREP